MSVENLQLNREDGKVEKAGTTGGAVETAVTGDATTSEALKKMQGRFRLDLTTLKGTATEKAAEALAIYESAQKRTDAELIGLYNATGEEKAAMMTLMNHGVSVDLTKDSAKALKDDDTEPPAYVDAPVDANAEPELV